MPSSVGDAGRRVCLLTGAGGQLGSAFCTRYAAEYDIVAVCRRQAPPVPSQYETFVDPLGEFDGKWSDSGSVHLLQADLTKDADLDRIVEVTLARYGRVDVLVNNAAYARWHSPGLLDEVGTFADADQYFRLNTIVPARLAAKLGAQVWQHRAAENRASNRSVVNVSSLAGSKVFGGGQALYAASKAALDQMTRHLAAEFGTFGVRVNAVAPNSFPGFVSTESVLDAITALDTGSDTGRIVPLDASS